MGIKREKQFYETVKKDIKTISPQENSWINLPISESLQAQLDLFKLWVIMEKTTASLMQDGQRKDGDWNSNFYCDTIDYGITLFLLSKYRLDNSRALRNFICQGKAEFVSSTELPLIKLDGEFITQ